MESIHCFDFPSYAPSAMNSSAVVPTMRKPAKSNRRRTHRRRLDEIHSGMLDVLLALDRVVVEFSMNVYSVPLEDRIVMREQNRQLHHAVRTQVPRLREISRTVL